MPAVLIPLIPWIVGGGILGAVGYSFGEIGDGVSKIGDGVLKGAIGGAVLYYVIKKAG